MLQKYIVKPLYFKTRSRLIFAPMVDENEIATEEISEELYERKSFTIDKGQEPMRIDKWVKDHIENASRNKIQQAISANFLTVNGKPVKNNYKTRPGDEILLMSFTNPEFTEIKPENIPLNIVYEDDDLMVINKPCNLVVHPAVGNYSGTLLNGVLYYLQQQNPSITEEDLPRYGLVHRIDKNTTGLMVIAKNAVAAAFLAKQFFNHTVHRRYMALVWGNVENDEGTIEAHIGRHKQQRKMFDAFTEGDYGKHAITHYKVLQRFNYVTLIECRLETGRTHQIRVHMRHIGHTLFNDADYGGNRILKGTVYTKYKQFVENCFKICPRVALHAASLGFIHPTTGKQIIFETELPDDMKGVIEKWGNYIGHKEM